MKVLDTDYKFLDENEHLGKNLILVGLGGSRAYGTNRPDSDVDIRGIATRTAEDILLGKDFEQVTESVETDGVIYSFDKMLTLLAECNPNTVEMLGLKDYIYVSEVGQLLLDNKKIFISQQCAKTFAGYANQQLYRLRQKSLDALSDFEYNQHIAKVIKGMYKHLEEHWDLTEEEIQVVATERGLMVTIQNIKGYPMDKFVGMCSEISNTVRTYNKHSSRNQKAMLHGKIAKHAMHLIRLYMTCIDLLEQGEIITYREKEHDLLMAIRNGEFTATDKKVLITPQGGLEEVPYMTEGFWKILEEWEAKFEKAKEKSKLPMYPNFEAIEKLKLEVNSGVVLKALT